MTIPITFFRSSSLNRWQYCQALYFHEYALGYTGEANKKANIGTASHKVFEYMGILKKEFDAGKKYVDLEICGKTKTKNYDLQKIIKDVYLYYKELFKNQEWEEKEHETIQKNINFILTYNNGQYNPQNLKIISTEVKFDYELIRDWSYYSYTVCGKKYEGFLRLKGSVDLVFEPTSGIYNIADLKTGKRINWATGEEKTQEYIQNDEQLCFYFYALSNLYPDVEIWASLIYVNDGGAFTVCFDKAKLKIIENKIRQRFEEIKNCNMPLFNNDWKCRKLCHMYKETFENTNIKSIQEFRNGQFNKRGEIMCKCSQIKLDLERKGLEKTINEYTSPGFTLGHYQEPGGSK